ncbi:MAG: hypothetical protein C0501_22965 [Isosphaera sp.]|nr:hypothetical protein [Isosphaera sp.]
MSVLAELIGQLRTRRVQAEEEARGRDRAALVREVCQGWCDSLAGFGPDRVIVPSWRRATDEDLYDQWVRGFIDLGRWLRRHGLIGRLDRVSVSGDPATGWVVAALRSPDRQAELAGSLRTAVEDGVLGEVRAALRRLPGELLAGAPDEEGLPPVARPPDAVPTPAASADEPPRGGEPEPSRVANLFRREGSGWHICYSGAKAFWLPNSKGLNYVAHLLQRPKVSVEVLELVAAVGQLNGSRLRNAEYSQMSTEDLSGMGLSVSGLGGSGRKLDLECASQVRKRWSELQEEIEEARSDGDPGRVERAQREVQELARYMEEGLDWWGRPREDGAARERARLSVRKAIWAAVESIQRSDPRLGQHLDKSVTTGASCSYDPGEPVHWSC